MSWSPILAAPKTWEPTLLPAQTATKVANRVSELRAAPEKLSDKLIRMLPEVAQKPVRGFTEAVSDAFFGNPRDRAVLQEREEQGDTPDFITSLKYEGFMSFLGKGDTEKINERAYSLRQKGIEPERATDLAFYDIFKDKGINFSDIKDKSGEEAKKKLAELAPTKEEQDVLALARTGDLLGAGADALGAFPLSVAKKGAFKELEILIKEAGRFKTAEEFVASPAVRSGLTNVETKALNRFIGATPEEKLTDLFTKAKAGQLDDTVERGFVTSAKEVMPDNLKIAGRYVPRDTDELSIKAANLVKDDIRAAERLALEGDVVDDRAIATASELLKFYSKAADEATTPTIRDAIYDRAAEVANTVARKLTESGRAVQAASILGRLTPEGQIRFAAKEIERYNRANPGKKIPELTGEMAKEISEEMKSIMKMPEGDEKIIAFQKLQDKIRSIVPSKWWEKAIAVWKAGLLTGLKTSGLNIFANLAHAGTEVAKDVPAAAADFLIGLVTGKRTVTATVRGVPEGIKEGAEKGWRYLKTGYDARDIAAKLEYRPVNFKNKILQGYVDTVFKVIGAEDQPFYYGALRRSLYNQAKAAAKTKKLSGPEAKAFIKDAVENPTDEMSAFAVSDAETAVFQNKTALGEAGTKAKRVFPGAEFVIPFARTPSAVAMQMLNYTPVGAIASAAKAIATKKFNQRALSQAIGRSAVGTGVLWLGGQLYANDMVTLDTPTTEREKELWKVEGRKANSIRVGDDWRTVQSLGPAGPVLLMGAHFAKAMEGSGSPTEAITEAVFGTAKSFTEQTFLKGVSDLIGAISDPGRNGEFAVQGFVSSFIPTIISDVARATDPKERRTENVADALLARIPGARTTLQPQVDVLGNERDSIGNPLEIIADPTRPSPVINTPVGAEFRRITDAGFPVSPTLLGDREGYKGLTPEQNTRLWKRAGEIITSKVGNYIQSEAYQKLDDEKKSKQLASFVQKSQDVARAEMVLELTQGLGPEETKAKLSELKKNKILTEDVFKRYNSMR